jgi:hypothetical protein
MTDTPIRIILFSSNDPDPKKQKKIIKEKNISKKK